MGLLDDAIREHLDLKRRRGADPSEIAREESEALGPVRRAELEAAPADEGPQADYDDGGYEESGGSVRYEEPSEPGRPEERGGSVRWEPEDERDRLVPSEPPQTHEAPYAEPESESASPPHGDPLLHQQTREFSAHELDEALGEAPPPAERGERGAAADAPADAHSEGEDEDVLEETPEFLQETPEHDRLWFEQKPPKDFDF